MIINKDGESYLRLTAFMEAETTPCIMAPFMGALVPIIVNRLTFAQIRACGDFSLIETVSDVIGKKRTLSPAEMIRYAEMQYNIMRAALKSPSYDEIMSLNHYDVLRKNAESEIVGIKAAIDTLPIGPKRDKLQLEYDTLRMDYDFLLPVDFVSYILSYALQIDDTDIKLLSEDMLFEAAARAKAGSGNPSDHLPGNFTDFNRVDINNRALVVYHQRIKENGSTS